MTFFLYHEMFVIVFKKGRLHILKQMRLGGGGGIGGDPLGREPRAHRPVNTTETWFVVLFRTVNNIEKDFSLITSSPGLQLPYLPSGFELSSHWGLSYCNELKGWSNISGTFLRRWESQCRDFPARGECLWLQHVWGAWVPSTALLRLSTGRSPRSMFTMQIPQMLCQIFWFCKSWMEPKNCTLNKHSRSFWCSWCVWNMLNYQG